MLLKKSPKVLSGFALKSLLLSTAVFVGGAQAQYNITKELQPKSADAPVEAKSKNTKSRKISKKRTVTANRSPVRNIAQPQTPVVPVPTESSDQIIRRFTNYQQTSGVSERDWQSVINQTQNNQNSPNARAQMLFARGEMAYRRADYSNALINFNGASQSLPTSALPYYGIGRVYLATKQSEQAENAFEKAIKLERGFALAYKGMGDALTAQGKSKKAQEYYSEAAKLGFAGRASGQSNPPSNIPNNGSSFANNSQPAQPNVSPNSVYESELRSARALTAGRKWAQSMTKLQNLMRSYPTADVYIAMGDNYMGTKKMLSAQQSYRKATELNPNSAMAFYKTGLVMYEMNEFQASSDALEKSLILDQQGTVINRQEARKIADEAGERVRNPNGRKKFLKIF